MSLYSTMHLSGMFLGPKTAESHGNAIKGEGTTSRWVLVWAPNLKRQNFILQQHQTCNTEIIQPKTYIFDYLIF